MELQTKHRLKLLNAKCEVVCKVQSLYKQMQYGDVATCCTRKLFAAIKLINRLDCYCFVEPTTDTLTNGLTTLTIGDDSPVANGIYQLFNGDTILSSFNASSNTELTVYSALIASSGLAYTTSVPGIDQTKFSITTDCSIEDLTIKVDGAVSFSLDVQTMPTCEAGFTTCYNCIEDSDLSKMYTTLDALLS